MEYMAPDEFVANETTKILCCGCGVLIEPNPSNMCIGCLRTQVDITEGIPKQVVIYFCKGCERYMQQQGQWIVASLESRELLSLCLKKLKGLNKVRLVDANFVWTEPHSKRLKIKLSIQKEVMNGAILQQVFVVEYVVNNYMCDMCHRVEAKDFWRASVQVRQKVLHKKTFFYLEQLVLKHKAHANCVNIKATSEGLDFYFDKKDNACKLVDFIQMVIPCRSVASQKLMSHDAHNNTYDYKHSYSVEIVPICKDDIVCLPPQLARSLGQIGQICICIRVTNHIYLIDPLSLKTAEMNSQVYWRHSFRSMGNMKQYIEYTVMNKELLRSEDVCAAPGHRSEKHALADVWVVKSSELGRNENQIHTRTHLGHLLNIGDTVMGFDLANANLNDSNFEKYQGKNKSLIPDAILVKKVYGDKMTRKRMREWKLRRLQVDNESIGSTVNNEFNDFMEDLEEDPISRQNVNIYRDREKANEVMAVDTDEMDNEDFPQVTLQEMLDDLNLDEENTAN